jgi:pyruvate formate lyase activating enzyme
MSYEAKLNYLKQKHQTDGSCDNLPPLGIIHSLESMSTCDGPGMRQVIFFQGCPLRCASCHNPDSWQLSSGKTMDVETLINWVKRYRVYVPAGGSEPNGVTVSGGEPLLQACFLLELLYRLKLMNIHTALDTSGWPHAQKNDCLLMAILAQTDLIMLDIKAINNADYQAFTGVSAEGRNYVLRLAIKTATPVWFRHVIIPGTNMDDDNLRELAIWIRDHYRSGLKLERITLLPFHQLGRHKYEELDIAYKLSETSGLTQAETAETRIRFTEFLRAVAPDLKCQID